MEGEMEFKEITVESKRIYEGRVLNLRVDTVRLPDGRVSTREIVEHKGAVAIVPMLEKDKIVMVRQYRQAAGRMLLEIPAGGLEIGESPEDCARRELAEEIGYDPGKLTLLFDSYLAPGYSSEKLHTYLAEDLRPKTGECDSDEFIEVITVGLNEALKLIESREIADAKSICGILMAYRLFNCG